MAQTIFDSRGHLTDEAFQTLMDETLSEQGRLQAAEHMAVCDRCVLRYTELLCAQEDRLLAPPAPQADGVFLRIKRYLRGLWFTRYGKVGIAACLSLVLWGAGFFSGGLPVHGEKLMENLRGATQTITSHTVQFTQDVADGIREFFDQFQSKGDSDREKK